MQLANNSLKIRKKQDETKQKKNQPSSGGQGRQHSMDAAFPLFTDSNPRHLLQANQREVHNCWNVEPLKLITLKKSTKPSKGVYLGLPHTLNKKPSPEAKQLPYMRLNISSFIKSLWWLSLIHGEFEDFSTATTKQVSDYITEHPTSTKDNVDPTVAGNDCTMALPSAMHSL